jgi:hypothetical protein
MIKRGHRNEEDMSIMARLARKSSAVLNNRRSAKKTKRVTMNSTAVMIIIILYVSSFENSEFGVYLLLNEKSTPLTLLNANFRL